MSTLSWVLSLYSSAPPINTVEGVYWWAQIVTLFLILATVATGGITVAAGIIASRRSAEKMRELDAARVQALRDLEAEKVTRLEMEKALAPRVIPFLNFEKGKSNLDLLKNFAGQPVVIEFLPDFESRRAASELQTALEVAGWKILGVKPNQELWTGFWEGVVSEPYVGMRSPNLSDERREIEMKATSQSREAAIALTSFLQDHDWKARTHGGTTDIPLQSIKISVGFKPSLPSRTFEEAGELFNGPKPPIPLERTEQRHLTPEQQKKAAQYLSELNENRWKREAITPVEIKCPGTNNEACAFAHEIAELLRTNGWPVKGDGIIRDKNFPRRLTGISIAGYPHKSSGVTALRDVLATAGVTEVLVQSEPRTRYDPLQVLVGW